MPLFPILHRIERKLDRMLERTTQMVDFTTFDAAMSSLGDEMNIVATDVQTVIGMLTSPDATAQAKVDAAATALTAINDKAKAIAAAAEAAAAPPAPAPSA